MREQPCTVNPDRQQPNARRRQRTRTEVLLENKHKKSAPDRKTGSAYGGDQARLPRLRIGVTVAGSRLPTGSAS